MHFILVIKLKPHINTKNRNAAELVLTPHPEIWNDHLSIIRFLAYLLWEQLQPSAVCIGTHFLYSPLI
ncbi:high light inducible protein [Nostoc sp. C110]|uniref:high light inducible protein n=1 Tax=Nostoc sp. C110 TaxID=3349876 RepID=UPI00370D610B